MENGFSFFAEFFFAVATPCSKRLGIRRRAKRHRVGRQKVGTPVKKFRSNRTDGLVAGRLQSFGDADVWLFSLRPLTDL